MGRHCLLDLPMERTFAHQCDTSVDALLFESVEGIHQRQRLFARAQAACEDETVCAIL